MAKLLLKCIEPSASKMSSLFTTRSLCILLGLVMMGDLIAGAEPTCSGAEATCSGCSRTSTSSSSFTVRNALPQSISNLHMVCSIWSDCGGFSTYSADFPCNDIEVPLNEQTSPCTCTSTPPATCTCTSTLPAVRQVLCEFTWTNPTVPTNTVFIRAQVLVWSGETAAPNKTYYLVDQNGFWFSNATDGTLSFLGPWVDGNYLSAVTAIMNPEAAGVKGFGRLHCLKTA